MRGMLFVLAAVALAGACSGETRREGQAGPAGSDAPPAASPIAVNPAAGPPPAARKEHVSNALYEFEYAYPVAAAAVPTLREWLDADLEKQRRELIAQAQSAQADSKANGYPFNPLGDWVAWKVVADLPGWLSLSAEVSTYEGGAHPNHGFDAMIWDRQADVRRAPLDLFASGVALSGAIRRDFCRLLNAERAKRRGAPIDPASTDEFDRCIDPVESTVILGSSNGKAFDRIGILVAPYSAGPYAEGDYEITLPVTDAVLAVVKPQYRPTFVKGR